jgi:pimeloyl-ACP methyl ester carboxylesterase
MSTIILLHGAYQGGWIWNLVAAELRARGHIAFAPTLDGCAERHLHIRPGITTETHGEEIASFLFWHDLRDVVLVGTSTGGMVLCAAAERARERIARLVFADALALRDGERLDDIVARPTKVNTALTSGPPREDAEKRLFADFPPELKQWALERYTKHPIAAMEAPVTLPSFWQQPWDATVVWCRRSPNPPKAHQERVRDALGARWHELDTGHYPMLTEPHALAEIIAAG